MSFPDEDVAFVDRYAHDHGVSRSAAMHEAVQTLRRRDLAADYEAAAAEWVAAGEAEVWDAVTDDVARMTRRLGALPSELLAELDDALRLHLDL